jgi:hypothetical protein
VTCVVGLVHEGDVWIGADAAGTAGWDLTIRRDPKVFLAGDALVGFTSSFRMGQLLRYGLGTLARNPNVDPYEHVVTAVANEVRSLFDAGGFSRRKEESEVGGVFLLGYAGRLFTIDQDYGVGEALEPYAAVGSGAQVALGALNVLSWQDNLPPRQKLIYALNVAERHNASVRGPFTVLSLAKSLEEKARRENVT